MLFFESLLKFYISLDCLNDCYIASMVSNIAFCWFSRSIRNLQHYSGIFHRQIRIFRTYFAVIQFLSTKIFPYVYPLAQCCNDDTFTIIYHSNTTKTKPYTSCIHLLFETHKILPSFFFFFPKISLFKQYSIRPYDPHNPHNIRRGRF